MDYLPRILTRAAETALTDTPVVLVCGARQTGKSTFVGHVADRARAVTLDDPLSAAAAVADPRGFLEAQGDVPLIIDEVQRVPELLRAIKMLVDRDRRPGRFLLTGSANVLALPRISESLAGRMEVLRLHPLSQLEIQGRGTDYATFVDELFGSILTAHDRGGTRDELLARVIGGGYPEAHLRDEKRRAAWFRSYLGTVLQREVRDITRVTDSGKLATLLQMVAARSTQALNQTTLARDLSTPWNTIDNYLALLRTTFLISTIEAWGRHVNPRAGSHPKVLVSDSGLAASLLRVPRRESDSDRTMLGNLFECFVGNELLRLTAHEPDQYAIRHYRTQRGEEVDFVIERADGAVVGVEVKLSGTVTASDFRGLRALRRDAGTAFVRGVILHTGETTAPFGGDGVAVPVSALWS